MTGALSDGQHRLILSGGIIQDQPASLDEMRDCYHAARYDEERAERRVRFLRAFDASPRALRRAREELQRLRYAAGLAWQGLQAWERAGEGEEARRRRAPCRK